jgi:hypothetical protein
MKMIEITSDLTPATQRCKAGTFTYTDASGDEVSADFYVLCPPKEDGNTVITDRRIDALNEQFTDVWTKLEEQSCTNIKYKDVVPSPFF